MKEILLTQLSHGGGCGCKIAPGVLSRLLQSAQKSGIAPPQLLVGLETSDDAAVYQLNDEQAIVATTDFFMPIVDDPRDFGRIAAVNALSDIYAMGGRPLFALAVVGMPLDKLPEETISAILSGGEMACTEAGIVIAGGHSIDAPEPIYGLVAIGVVHPQQLRRNNGAKQGDKIILSKPLGIGMLSAALKKGTLDKDGYAEMIRWTTKLNVSGIKLGEIPAVHAMTDVTGFGLGGHALEMCRGAKLEAQVDFAQLPLIPLAKSLAEQGTATGASARNWQSYGEEIDGSLADWQRNLLTDPQTSGGLLIACAEESVKTVLALLQSDGFTEAAVIGQFVEGKPRLNIKA